MRIDKSVCNGVNVEVAITIAARLDLSDIEAAICSAWRIEAAIRSTRYRECCWHPVSLNQRPRDVLEEAYRHIGIERNRLTC